MDLYRRSFTLGAALLAGSVLTAGATAAGVFEGLTQDELDRAYNQRDWAKNAAAVQARYIARSAEIARQMPPISRRYGPGQHEIVDIFAPHGANHAPVFVVIHGGAWRLAIREAYYGPAPAIVQAGCVCVVVGFDCLPALSLAGMVAQIRQALVWIAREIGRFGGDGSRLNLIGHSSGSHLAGMMMTTDWARLGPPVVNLRSATLLSGIYELYPVMLSSRQSYLHLSAADVVDLSPMRHLDRLTGSVIVAWAAKDSPEFKRQSRVFASAAAGMGREDLQIEVADVNHFELYEQLYDPNTPLMRAALLLAKQ